MTGPSEHSTRSLAVKTAAPRRAGPALSTQKLARAAAVSHEVHVPSAKSHTGAMIRGTPVGSTPTPAGLPSHDIGGAITSDLHDHRNVSSSCSAASRDHTSRRNSIYRPTLLMKTKGRASRAMSPLRSQGSGAREDARSSNGTPVCAGADWVRPRHGEEFCACSARRIRFSLVSGWPRASILPLNLTGPSGTPSEDEARVAPLTTLSLAGQQQWGMHGPPAASGRVRACPGLGDVEEQRFPPRQCESSAGPQTALDASEASASRSNRRRRRTVPEHCRPTSATPAASGVKLLRRPTCTRCPGCLSPPSRGVPRGTLCVGTNPGSRRDQPPQDCARFRSVCRAGEHVTGAGAPGGPRRRKSTPSRQLPTSHFAPRA
jgi:hypothetical protein